MKTFYLYLKQSPLGLKYLGITTRDPYKYKGSGKYWIRHLKYYKLSSSDIITTILKHSTIESEINQLAAYYSIQLDIVNSSEYANLMPESGINYTMGRVCSEETKQKISKANLGKIPSEETIRKIIKNRKSTKGFKHSNETKLKLSNFRKGKTLSVETIEKMKAKTTGKRLIANFREVHQYSLLGEYLNTYPSITDAVSSHRCDVFNAASGRYKTAGGFQWRFDKFDKIEPFVHKDNILKNSKTVYQYSLSNEFIKEWQGTNEPSIVLSIHRGAIRNCLSGISKTAGGFIWKYKIKDNDNRNKKN